MMRIKAKLREFKTGCQKRLRSAGTFIGRSVKLYAVSGEPRWKAIAKKIARILLYTLYGVVMAPSFVIGLVVSSLIKLTDPSSKVTLKTHRLDKDLERLIASNRKIKCLMIEKGGGERVNLTEESIQKIVRLAPERLELDTHDNQPEALLYPSEQNFIYRQRPLRSRDAAVYIKKALIPVYELEGSEIEGFEKQLKELIDRQLPIHSLRMRGLYTEEEMMELMPLFEELGPKEVVLNI